jgi:hypothetical protein
MVAAKRSRCWQFVQVQRADLHFDQFTTGPS